jgi:hypothetical protein
MIDIYEVAGRNGSETVWRQESIGVPDVGAVWFVAKRATLYLRLVARIEELTLGRKVWQSVAS